jgi:hypothetical protein
MAFKRAFVHAIINATNTSELWSQDLEDLAANGMAPNAPETSFEDAKQSQPSATNKTPLKGSTAQQATSETPDEPFTGDWRDVLVPNTFPKTGGMRLGDLTPEQLDWLIDNYKVKATYEKNGKTYKSKPEWIADGKRFRAALDAVDAEPERAEDVDTSEVPF